MNILGLNAFHGDSSACLFVDGAMISAVEEERFRRAKHWAGFPSRSIEFCLQAAGINLSHVDVVAINTDPNAARWRKMAYALKGNSSLSLIKEKLNVRRKRAGVVQHLQRAFPDQVFAGKLEHVEHHLAHLASAYSVSPYSQASIISIDGFGDFASAANGFGDGHLIDLQSRVYFPHSMGIFYQALTQYLGFPHYGDEYKVMGLAPYGSPKFAKQMDDIVAINTDTSFQLNLDYFVHHKQPISYQGVDGSPQIGELFSSKMSELLGPKRATNEPLTQHHYDLARSIQDVYERVLFERLNSMHKQHKCDNLAIAGGCGMNSVANGKIHLNTPYKNIYVQSAAGDAGGAIGAAIIAGQRSGQVSRFTMAHSYWGPNFSDDELKSVLANNQLELNNTQFAVEYDLASAALNDRVSDQIIQGNVVGWFQGAMEWGPRALGNRSILGDPRRADMKDILNLRIKRRESFRPFAPSVLREHVGNWFESDADVPFMMKVFQVKESQRTQIPSVTHVDGSGQDWCADVTQYLV